MTNSSESSHDSLTALQGKRILLTTFGSLGDLHPYLALARGLQALWRAAGDWHQCVLPRYGGEPWARLRPDQARHP